MTPHAHVEISSSSDEEAAGPWFEPFHGPFPKKQKETVIIYHPPPGIKYIVRDGRYILDVPVYSAETAKTFLEFLFQRIRWFLCGNQYGDQAIDLQKLFMLVDACPQALALLKKDNANK